MNELTIVHWSPQGLLFDFSSLMYLDHIFVGRAFTKGAEVVLSEQYHGVFLSANKKKKKKSPFNLFI